MAIRVFIISIFVLLVLAPQQGLTQNKQTNSLYLRAETKMLARKARGGLAKSETSQQDAFGEGYSGNGGSVSAIKASWFTVDEPEPKDFRVHDLVTIVVHEVSKHTTKADTKADREYSFDARIEEYIRFADQAIQPALQKNGSPRIKLSLDKEFEGEGDIKREDTLSARIQAEIIDVLPNGNLVLEAAHTVITDAESSTITLTGMCRSKDVGIDNSVLSSRLHDLMVRKFHSGMAHDATRRGIISGLFDWINLF